MVAKGADEPDAPAVPEHGAVGNNVGKMLAAAIGIVGDDDVVWAPLIRGNVIGENLGEKTAHRVEMARNAGGLRHVPAVTVEDGGGVIEQFADDGGATGSPHRHIHFGGRGRKGVENDLELDR